MTVRAIQLDFIRSGGDTARFVAWALLLGAVLLCGWVFDRQQELQFRREDLQARQERLQHRLSSGRAGAATAPLDAAAQRRIQRANTVIDQLAVPWSDLFSAVESVALRGVAITGLVPNAQEQTLRLSGEAKDLKDVLVYVDRLAEQPMLQQVHLVGYETVQRDGLALISFSLSAVWRPL